MEWGNNEIRFSHNTHSTECATAAVSQHLGPCLKLAVDVLQYSAALQYCKIAILEDRRKEIQDPHDEMRQELLVPTGTKCDLCRYLARRISLWLEVASSILQQAPSAGLHGTNMAASAGASGRLSRRPHWLLVVLAAVATIEAAAAVVACDGPLCGDAGPASDSSFGAAGADFDWWGYGSQCRSCAPLRGRDSVNATATTATPSASALGWWALVTKTVWKNDLDSGVAFTDVGWLQHNAENDTRADCGNHAESNVARGDVASCEDDPEHNVYLVGVGTDFDVHHNHEDTGGDDVCGDGVDTDDDVGDDDGDKHRGYDERAADSDAAFFVRAARGRRDWGLSYLRSTRRRGWTCRRGWTWTFDCTFDLVFCTRLDGDCRYTLSCCRVRTSSCRISSSTAGGLRGRVYLCDDRDDVAVVGQGCCFLRGACHVLRNFVAACDDVPACRTVLPAGRTFLVGVLYLRVHARAPASHAGCRRGGCNQHSSACVGALSARSGVLRCLRGHCPPRASSGGGFSAVGSDAVHAGRVAGGDNVAVRWSTTCRQGTVVAALCGYCVGRGVVALGSVGGVRLLLLGCKLARHCGMGWTSFSLTVATVVPGMVALLRPSLGRDGVVWCVVATLPRGCPLHYAMHRSRLCTYPPGDD